MILDSFIMVGILIFVAYLKERDEQTLVDIYSLPKIAYRSKFDDSLIFLNYECSYGTTNYVSLSFKQFRQEKYVYLQFDDNFGLHDSPIERVYLSENYFYIFGPEKTFVFKLTGIGPAMSSSSVPTEVLLPDIKCDTWLVDEKYENYMGYLFSNNNFRTYGI
tara:strand:- start:29756 stop:30241 length:486 start_codon:yes stop_codon:yes gene_type:complete